MTKPLVSLARRIATMAALLAGIAMLGVAGASVWLINQEHAASLRSLLKKDAELQAASISNSLGEIAGRISELSDSPLITNALLDSAGKENYLTPLLNGIRRIQGIPVAIVLTDFEGREIARNRKGGFSEQELSWLKEKLPSGQAAARVQPGADGKGGEELMAVEFIVFAGSNEVQGALLYRIKLDDIRLQDGVRLVRGPEAEQLLHSQAAIAAAVVVPPIYKDLNFAVLTSSDPPALSVDWQRLGLFFILAVGVVVMVMVLGLHFGKRLTRDLQAVEFFARRIAAGGFRATSAEAAGGLEAGGLEVASLTKSINHMLERLTQEHDKLHESEERFRLVFKYSQVGVNIGDTDGRYVDVNSAFVEMMGYSKEELLGRNAVDFTHPNDLETSAALINTLLTGGGDYYRIEKKYLRKDGSTLWADVTISAGRDDAGKLVSVIGIIHDITERKQADIEVRRVGDLLRGSLDVLDEAFAIYDPQDRLTLCNDKYREVYSEVAHLMVPGAQFEDTIRAGAEMGLHAAAIGRVDEWVAERLASHLAANTTLIQKHSNGRTLRIVERRLPDGHIVGFRVDISESVREQDEILRLNARLEERVIQLRSQQEELRQSTDQIRDSEAILSATINTALDGVVQIDPAGIITRWNNQAEKMFGWLRDEAIGLSLHETIIPPQYRAAHLRGMHHFLSTGEGPVLNKRIEISALRRDGHEFPIELSITPLKVGDKSEFSAFVRDITERKQYEKKRELAASVFTHAREGIVITDAVGTIVDVNDTFTRITGYLREEALGQNPRILKSDRQPPEFHAAMWGRLTQDGHWSGEIWNRRKNGDLYAAMQTVSAVRDASGTTQHYISLFIDITTQKEQQQQLEHIAHYDALTNLPNRMLLDDRLHQAMLQSQRRGKALAVAYLDLDGFKQVNDIHGHAVGDEMLVLLSQHIKAVLREGDTLARIGGDEFVVVLVDLENPADCKPVLARLLQAASQPVTVGDAVLHVSASIGVTLCPQDGTDADLLLRYADQAMYIAKDSGKNRCHFFDAASASAVQTQRESLRNIAHAMAQHEFVLYYQPKVNMKTGAVVGAEALIRWQHPVRGLLAPAAFLPLIENHPLSVELGEWVIATAIAQMGAWRAQDMDLSVSVNIGAHQLQQPDFAERLGDMPYIPQVDV